MMFFFAAVLALADPQFSHDPPLRRTGDWETIYKVCSEAIKPPPDDRDPAKLALIKHSISVLSCDSFIMGAWGMHENLVALGKTERQFCIPLQTTKTQVRKVVQGHMETFQKKEHDHDAASAVLLALRFAFGSSNCK